MTTKLTSGVALIDAKAAWTSKGVLPVYGAPEGADAMALAEAASVRNDLVVHIARDGARAAAMIDALGFFAPDIPVLEFPAWDCLPYDRVSPSSFSSSRRMATLAALGARAAGPCVLVTSVNAAIQRTPPKSAVENAAFSLAAGAVMSIDRLSAYLAANGYARASTVREPGEFAVRGGLVDIFPPGGDAPVRLDFFGDQLETIRTFDAETQRTIRQLPRFELSAASEILLSDETIARFRGNYVRLFGPAGDDPLYEAVSAGRTHAGAEHWLPLFYESVDTLFDFTGDALVLTDHLLEESVDARLATIADHFSARSEDIAERKSRKSDFDAPTYRPLPSELLYFGQSEWTATLKALDLRPLSPFAPPENTRAYHFGAKVGRSFAAERAAENINVFDKVLEHAKGLKDAGKTPIIACWSEGSADRMGAVLADHSGEKIGHLANWREVGNSAGGLLSTAVIGLETGFETARVAFISEQDILGDRLVRRTKKKRAENFLTEASSLGVGDLVVHVDHGIGRYQGLKTLEVQGAPHDCLHLEYHGGDKLFLPVENIDLLSRFGSDDPDAMLDKLGGAAWQGRKAKMRARIKMLAEQLIKIAAKRAMNKAEVMEPTAGLYDEFCARFPFAETEDQENAIADVMEDLAKGAPMDRLVCGDVGFGKTEVALRAAFVGAMTGRQVAVIAPTTLLVRQHYRNFSERFKGFPIKVAQLSRMVSAKDAGLVRDGLANGQVDIVVGTHALLAKSIKFRDLGLIIVDEEQHFGVKHKERLKEFRGDTHVLTLTATPIPRTLQLAMSGIRDLSLIATPPVDRLAVRTTVGPFDPVVARETLLREHYRGGQSFYVAPRISDLKDIAAFLEEQAPELKFKIAHGQMPPGELEDIMTAYYEGKFEVLVSTTIVESGLDIPTANTILIHHADMFGLSQLYQLRGRVGRSKQRAYAYLTTSPRKKLTAGAERRLKVMQSLDTLGAGFTLASHDLDIRGAGNLLGEEQSGHVKEVGVELYQHMLEEAVAELREGVSTTDDAWSPQINIGTSVLIPETYVADLDVRMALYRRLGDITEEGDIDGFAAELVDRFGRLPTEVEHLLQIVAIKAICRRAGVAKIDAGPKGAVITFRNDQFANVAGLVEFMAQSPLDVKLRPDQKFVYRQAWAGEKMRLKGARKIAEIIAEIAAEAP